MQLNKIKQVYDESIMIPINILPKLPKPLNQKVEFVHSYNSKPGIQVTPVTFGVQDNWKKNGPDHLPMESLQFHISEGPPPRSQKLHSTPGDLLHTLPACADI